MTRAAAESVADLLLSLRADGIVLWAEEGRLRFDAPAGAMTPALRAELGARKAEIVAFLHEADVAERSSTWITMPDGVRLAADVHRPKRAGVVVDGALPVVWCLERYRRAEVVRGGVTTKLDSQPWLKALLRGGYVVAVVDARGSGASEGTRPVEFAPEETRDAHTVTEWFAAQPWCSGRVGMFGMSHSAIAQLLAAGTAPPHLGAIVPQMALFDLYDFLRPDGVFRDDFARNWADMVRRLDTGRGAAHTGETTETDVRSEHRRNAQVFTQAAALEYRDSTDPVTGLALYQDLNPARVLAAISASGVPVCHLTGWYDLWVRDTILWFRNLTNPQRLVIGPWSHNKWADDDIAREHLRWFDHWLKDIDNGVTREPPVRYFTMSAPPGRRWRTSDRWPPAHVRPRPLHLHDGNLLAEEPPATDGHDAHRVDYSATTGTTTRWSDGYGAGFRYDLTPNDRKALTYTTAVLTEDLEVTGHPVVHLWVTSSHPDGEFFVYLEEIDEQGDTHYVSEAVLRASHRALGTPPYDRMELPYHPGTADSVAPLPDEPVELVADLHPTSNVFAASRRLRLAVTCCDRDNAHVPERRPVPVVRVHHGPAHPSRLVLPVAPAL